MEEESQDIVRGRKSLGISQSGVLNRTNYDQVVTVNFSKFVSKPYEPISDMIHGDFQATLACKVLRSCQSQKTSFVDKEFEPGSSRCRGKTPCEELGETQWQSIQWARAIDILGKGDMVIFNEVSPNEIRQGILSNSYFLCAISILAEQRNLIYRLFNITEPNDEGVYSVWLFINGNWKEILVDDYLPIVEYDNGVEIAFSRASQDEIWVSLIEKAYAKAYGGYSNISRGNTIDALRDMTGAPIERLRITIDSEGVDRLWYDMNDTYEKGFIMCCTTLSNMNYGGIIEGFTYSIIGFGSVVDEFGQSVRMVKMRVPWGRGWIGQWSEQDPRWFDANYEAMDYYPSKDGCVCVSLEDFVHMFDYVYVVLVEDMSISGSLVLGKGTNERQKTTIYIESEEEQDCHLSIDQIDKRMFPGASYAYSPCRVMLARVDGLHMSLVDCVTDCKRNLFIKVHLNPGRYVCLVETYWAKPQAKSLVCGFYSNHNISIVDESVTQAQFDTIQHHILKHFAKTNIGLFSEIRKEPLRKGNLTAHLTKLMAEDQKNGMVMIAYMSAKANGDIIKNISIKNSESLEVISPESDGINHSLLIQKNSLNLMVMKFDPRGIPVDLEFQEMNADIVEENTLTQESSLVQFTGGEKVGLKHQRMSFKQSKSRQSEDIQSDNGCGACTLI